MLTVSYTKEDYETVKAATSIANCVGTSTYWTDASVDAAGRELRDCLLTQGRVSISTRPGGSVAVMSSRKRSNRVSIMGAKSMADMNSAIHIIRATLEQMGTHITFDEARLDNFLVILDLGHRVDQARMYRVLGSAAVHYAPKTIGSLRVTIHYRSEDALRGASCLVYDSGKVVITGMNSMHVAYEIGATLLGIVRPYFKGAPLAEAEKPIQAPPVAPGIDWSFLARRFASDATAIRAHPRVTELRSLRPVDLDPSLPLPLYLPEAGARHTGTDSSTCHYEDSGSSTKRQRTQ